MKYKAILFDLDGTLMPVSNEDFENTYLKNISEYLNEYIEPKYLLTSMYQALEAMFIDKSETKNEVVFFDKFSKLIGEELMRTLEPMFDAYYRSDFKILESLIKDNSKMQGTVKYLKEKGYKLIVATNPMFPQIAVEKRIEFSGLDLEDFDFVSNFHIHTSVKPHPEYYQEVLDFNNLDAEDCLMIGNDALEDGAAKKTGMDVWIITDHILNEEHVDKADWSGSSDAFHQYIKEIL